MKIKNILKSENLSNYRMPLFISRISAGFPSPADDYVENRLDINELIIKSPASTFFMRVSGDSMIKAGIFSNDLLVVDRSISPKNGDIIIACLDGEMTVKRLYCKNDSLLLLPENPDYSTIEIDKTKDFEIWGVVTYVIHQAK